jgi:hypothetical protein
MSKPYIKVMVTEVTDNDDDGTASEDIETHVRASISFDGVEQFSVSSIKLVHIDDDPKPNEVGRTVDSINKFADKWRERAAVIGVEFVCDQESIDEYLESFKEAP